MRSKFMAINNAWELKKNEFEFWQSHEFEFNTEYELLNSKLTNSLSFEFKIMTHAKT